MQTSSYRSFSLLAAGVMLLFVAVNQVSAQEGRRERAMTQLTTVGRGMGLITPSLIEIGLRTNFFLTLGGEIRMTDQQRDAIAEIAYRFQKYAADKKGDLGVAEAELERMLTRDEIDLARVKTKLSEMQSHEGDVVYAGIESAIKALKILSHEQHMKVMVLITNSSQPPVRTQ